MRGWRRGCRGSRLGRGGGGAWGRRRRDSEVSWALEKADRQDSLCHAIVDQVGIVDQGVKQVKAGISPGGDFICTIVHQRSEKEIRRWREAGPRRPRRFSFRRGGRGRRGRICPARDIWGQ